MLELLRAGLWERGHTVSTAVTAAEGQQLATAHTFDAIVLDVGLPDQSGHTVAEALRRTPQRPAIVMLTAQSDEDNVVSGLDSGADDYLTKPFSFSELQARIAAAHRRATLFQAGEVRFGAFTLDLRQHRLLHRHTEVRLSRTEYLLLHTLALQHGDPVPRRRLMQAVWNSAVVTQGALDTLVATLRERLAAEAGTDASSLILTLRGLGYALRRDTMPTVEVHA